MKSSGLHAIAVFCFLKKKSQLYYSHIIGWMCFQLGSTGAI